MKYFVSVMLFALSISGCGAKELTHRELIIKVRPSVVKIQSANVMGSGEYIITPKQTKILLTNEHVCTHVFKDPDPVAILFMRLLGKRFNVYPSATNFMNKSTSNIKVIKSDANVDLCALSVTPDEGMVPLKLAKESRDYEDVMFLGYVPETPFMASFGSLSERLIGFEKLQYTGAKAYPGNSGSPAVNTFGELIGVVDATDTRTANGFIIPLEIVKKFIEDV